ncbi:MAG TPA: hypothetical protein VHO47_04710 [Candidatus Babeliales bacterium]|nr:hypothetical protein [Candidatus Babeliales bacterium]
MSYLLKLRTVGLVFIICSAFQFISAHDEGPIKAETNNLLIGIRAVPKKMVEFLATLQKYYEVKAETTNEEAPTIIEKPLIKSMGVKLAPSNN